MIQSYKQNNTNYDSNGDMPLTPSDCRVSAELNGAWTISLAHPVDEEGRWKFITEGAVLKVPSFNGDQLFRLKTVTKTDTQVTATGEPIFMDAAGDCFLVDVRPTNDNGQQALDMMTAPNDKYSGQSNITKVSTAYYQFKNLIEAINGDDENSFISRWGGEIFFNNFKIIVNERIGEDNGVEVRYGKNIPKDGFTYEVDMSEVKTRIYPKAYNGYTMTDNGYVDSDLIDSYPTVMAATITFDDVKMAEDATETDEENGVIICNSQAELDAALTEKCEAEFAAGLDKPKVTITVDMIQLADTEQYKDVAAIETVSLGDTIHCYNSHLGISTEARIVEIEWDCTLKRVASVVIGEPAYNYFNSVTSSVNRVQQAIRPDGTVIGEQVAGFINGAMAQLRAQKSVARKQDVRAVFFEDTDPDSPTYGAMAIGTQGLQISRQRNEDGTDWVWTTALTAEGLLANVIVAGIIADKTGKSFWNLDTGQFVMEDGTIKAGNIEGGNISGTNISGTTIENNDGNGNSVTLSLGDIEVIQNNESGVFSIKISGNMFRIKREGVPGYSDWNFTIWPNGVINFTEGEKSIEISPVVPGIFVSDGVHKAQLDPSGVSTT
jgi:phage minor structural protein